MPISEGLKLRKGGWQDIAIIAVLAVCCVALWFVPTPTLLNRMAGHLVPARVLEVDDSGLMLHGVVLFGTQRLKAELLAGEHKGEVVEAANELRAMLELDKVFAPGDRILLAVPGNAEDHLPEMLNARDYDRSWWMLALFSLFCICLCIFGGWTGLKALFSFFVSAVVIWKAVIPLALKGWSASWTIFGCICFLTAAIVFLVAGLTRKGTAAFLGSSAGVLAGLLMTHCFARLLNINGAMLPYAQTVLFSGFSALNLQDLFIGAVMLASSGAVMDLSMDIAAGVEEVHRHSPMLSRKTLMASGMRIGRSVVGTMTTTLLLAYSGGYISLLMMFSTQDTPILEIINNPLVASEIVKTLTGSFALVLVAPFTAMFAGWMFAASPISIAHASPTFGILSICNWISRVSAYPDGLFGFDVCQFFARDGS